MPTPPPLDTPEETRTREQYSVIGLLLMLGLIVAFPLYRATEPDRRARAREAMMQEYVERGQKLFSLHCSSCHGEKGTGGRGMPTLAAQEFLRSVSDQQMHWLVAGGIPDSTMQAYHLDYGGPLTDQDIEQVVAFMRSLEPRAPSVPNWGEGPKTELKPEEAEAPAEPPVVSDTGQTSTTAADTTSSTTTSTVAPSLAEAASSTSTSTAAPTPDEVASSTPTSTAAPTQPGAASSTSTAIVAPVRAEVGSGASTSTPASSASKVTSSTATSTTAGTGSKASSSRADLAAGDASSGGAQLSDAALRKIYTVRCAACHGPSGEGTPVAEGLRPLPSPYDEDFEALVTIIDRGQPGTAMIGVGPAVDGPLDGPTVRALARWLAEGPWRPDSE